MVAEREGTATDNEQEAPSVILVGVVAGQPRASQKHLAKGHLKKMCIGVSRAAEQVVQPLRACSTMPFLSRFAWH
jgi:hypothetical protein